MKYSKNFNVHFRRKFKVYVWFENSSDIVTIISPSRIMSHAVLDKFI